MHRALPLTFFLTKLRLHSSFGIVTDAARMAGSTAVRTAGPAMTSSEHTGHSLDPDVYNDEGRPPGWYVDPDKPWRMRYWRTGEHEGWSKETTKTPEKAQSEWRDLRWRR